MRRTLLFALGGILLGLVIHIGIVFTIPYQASRDAWAQMERFGPDGEFHVLPVPEPGAEPLASLDPRLVHAVCRFTLADGPVRVRASLPDEFWSIAIFDRRGRNVYSLNDRSAERSQLDLAIITPVQMAQLRRDPPPALDTAIVLETPIEVGFALLRAFVPDESLFDRAASSLRDAECGGDL